MWNRSPDGAWKAENGVTLSRISARLSSEGRSAGRKVFSTNQADESRLSGRHRESSFELRLETRVLPDGSSALELTGEVSNHSNQPLRINLLKVRIDTVELPGDRKIRNRRFFKNGYQSWSETRSFGGRESEMRCWLPTMIELQDNPRNLPPHRGGRRRGKFRSDFFALLAVRDAEALLVGQVEGFNQLLYLRSRLNRLHRSPYVEVLYDFGGQLLPGHSAISVDPVLFLTGSNAETLQERFFEELRRRILTRGQRWSLAGRERAQVSQARRLLNFADRKPLSGWGSWYYYYTRVSMDDLRRNLRLAGRAGVDWDFFVLDDGYQAQLGDWLRTNEKFPEGLGAVAEEIRSHGFLPGIWLAPFVAGRGSSLYREHRNWFVHRYGPVRAAWNPHWGKDSLYYSLDLTNPEVQEYLRHVIATLTGEYGFRFLKLDFLYGGAAQGRCYDQRYSPAERLKLGYDLIRDAAGSEVVLLGCGSPLPQAVGRVEAMRVGPDVAPFWFDTVRYYLTRDPHAASTFFAVRSSINRSTMHRRLWLNDPDCLLMRERDILLNESERFSLAHAAVLTGGLFFLSDRLDLISEMGWKRIRKLQEISRSCAGHTVTPVGVMSTPVPEAVYNGAGYLGLFNFREERRPLRLSLDGPLGELLRGGKRLRDVWSGEQWPVEGAQLELGELERHASRLLAIEFD